MLRKLLVSSAALGLALLTPISMAQSVGTGPLAGAASLPANNNFALVLTMLAVLVAGVWALRNRNGRWLPAIIAPTLIVTSAAGLIYSHKIQAINPPVAVSLTNPSGEVIDLSASYQQGNQYFELTNNAGVSLRIKTITQPACGIGKSDMEAQTKPNPDTPALLEAPGLPTCEVGSVLTQGAGCSINFVPSCIPT
ncbi:midcut-by-XrtH protein [Gilvimarinus sp. SDUM040013]|uniref:Midcut-by-XrtH protein n=1 Tax=Gilvimarinus gilvus TaxID=3058038 RepID=A0ABU4RXG7_9GAMM|nr:midcut-by-XrtH protein [Gilvimarinus sp. SDUM040013]MDO3388620.1 midcut-by-XrtH protein [Gilvimarinus sp. SDUM040013]MDX6849515.1 midcut-by-XrtH protein [Gilvimarinus sp. SDUM040013]